MDDKSVAHKHDMNPFGLQSWPDRLVPWRPAREPNLQAPYTPGEPDRSTGRLRSCSYCGSMHPADLAAALRAGAQVHWADRKYGWPHKLYVEGIPNPHAGMLESRMSASHATPVCPKTGAACAHGEQRSGDPAGCACMQAGLVTQGTSGWDGQQTMRLVQNGFDRATGKPTHTWRHTGEPAGATTHGKFYTVHLQDASPEDAEVIQKAMGLRFTFDFEGRPGAVSWAPYTEPAANPQEDAAQS